VPCVWLELDLENILGVSNVALQDQYILVLLGFLTSVDGTILKSELIRAEIIGLEEDELIFMAGVQKTLVILAEGEV
jgi:hypothetical protein